MGHGRAATLLPWPPGYCDESAALFEDGSFSNYGYQISLISDSDKLPLPPARPGRTSISDLHRFHSGNPSLRMESAGREANAFHLMPGKPVVQVTIMLTTYRVAASD